MSFWPPLPSVGDLDPSSIARALTAAARSGAQGDSADQVGDLVRSHRAGAGRDRGQRQSGRHAL